jgi:hypothetical protein
MDTILSFILNECPSKLPGFLLEIARNPTRAMFIKNDALLFISQNCKWIQPPCPPIFVSIMQGIGMSIGPIGIIASYAYTPVGEQVKDILSLITSNEQSVLYPIIQRFDHLANNATCFIHERTTNMSSQDKILSLCMFANERININIEEREMRGTILCLGQLSLRPRVDGDCCSWSSVAGITSGIVTGESSKKLSTCGNAMTFLVDMIESMPEDIKDEIATGTSASGVCDEKNESTFSRILTIALAGEMLHPRRSVGDQIIWIKDNFNSLNEIQEMMKELEKKCIEEKKLYLRSLRLFIRHKIMEAVYESDRHPLFPALKCALCDKEAFMKCPCNTVRYCSSKCQSANWRRHKNKCKIPHI